MMVYLLFHSPYGGRFTSSVYAVLKDLANAKAIAQSQQEVNAALPNSTFQHKWAKRRDIHSLHTCRSWDYEGSHHDLDMDDHWFIEEWQVE